MKLLRSGVTIVLVSHNIALIEIYATGYSPRQGEVWKGRRKVIPYYENLVFQQRKMSSNK